MRIRGLDDLLVYLGGLLKPRLSAADVEAALEATEVELWPTVAWGAAGFSPRLGRKGLRDRRRARLRNALKLVDKLIKIDGGPATAPLERALLSLKPGPAKLRRLAEYPAGLAVLESSPTGREALAAARADTKLDRQAMSGRESLWT